MPKARPHSGHDMHAAHPVELFRDRFWISLALTVPVVFWSGEVEHCSMHSFFAAFDCNFTRCDQNTILQERIVPPRRGALALREKTMMTQPYDYIDGNAAAGELSKIFAVDITAAAGQCAHCGATKRFAEAHLYMQCPGLVARCAVCQNVLLRAANIRQRMLLDMRGIACLSFKVEA